MSVVDLKYAREGEAEKAPEPVLFAVHCQGWHFDWALRQGEATATAGSFHVPDHVEGQAVPHARQCMVAFASLAELLNRHKPTHLLTNEHDRNSPAATLLPITAMVMRAEYVTVGRDWLDELGLRRKELVSWATVALGKPVSEGIAHALGMSEALVRSKRRGMGRL